MNISGNLRFKENLSLKTNMTTVIKGYIEEVENIESEIKRNNTRNKMLRKRNEELKGLIAKYLNEKNEPGVKYNETFIILEPIEKRKQKSKKEKEKSIKELLQKAGIPDTENFYQQLSEIQKRSPEIKHVVKVKKIDKVKRKE